MVRNVYFYLQNFLCFKLRNCFEFTILVIMMRASILYNYGYIYELNIQCGRKTDVER